MKFLLFVTAANLEAILLVTSRVWRRSLGGAGAESPKRDFKMPRRRRRRERQNSNRLNSKNNNSASASRFFVHFFAATAQPRRKMPNFTFYGGSKQATAFFLSLSELEYGS